MANIIDRVDAEVAVMMAELRNACLPALSAADEADAPRGTEIILVSGGEQQA